MAARKSSRGHRAPIRPLSESNPKTTPAQSLPEPVRRYLEALFTTLRDIEGTVIVAAGALRDEESFVGMNVARVLRTQISNRLSREIDRGTELFAIELKTFKEEES